MSTIGGPPLRIVTFGDLSTGAWGAAWGAAEPSVVAGSVGPDDATPAAPGSGAPGSGAPARIEGTAAGGEWAVGSEVAELTLSPEGEPAPAADGFDQLCRVHGWIVVGTTRQAVDSLGRRGVRAALDVRALESVRDVSGWFGPGEGLALTALRSQGAHGHDRDVVTASLLPAPGVAAAAEPRLSTTYDGNGLPTRVGLELWLGEDEDGEQYARRLAGEALGAGGQLAGDELDVYARPLRWHSRGREGAGVYVLARPSLALPRTRASEPIR